MLDQKEPITSVEFISNRLQENEDIDITADKLKKFIKQELGMKYRKSRKIPV